jgi:hypothetical protein
MSGTYRRGEYLSTSLHSCPYPASTRKLHLTGKRPFQRQRARSFHLPCSITASFDSTVSIDESVPSSAPASASTSGNFQQAVARKSAQSHQSPKRAPARVRNSRRAVYPSMSLHSSSAPASTSSSADWQEAVPEAKCRAVRPLLSRARTLSSTTVSISSCFRRFTLERQSGWEGFSQGMQEESFPDPDCGSSIYREYRPFLTLTGTNALLQVRACAAALGETINEEGVSVLGMLHPFQSSPATP